LAASVNNAMQLLPPYAKGVPHPPRVAEGELLPVIPVEAAVKLWRTTVKRMIMGPRGMGLDSDYDIERLHGRLVVGMDRLWLALFTKGGYAGTTAGIVITSIGPPPSDRPQKLFLKERSLTVHFIAGHRTGAWIPDAIQKLTAYGKENGCRQIFVLMRRSWQHYMHAFFGAFERVGLARDRMVKNGQDPRNAIMRPGHFRLLEPLPPRLAYSLARRHRRKVYIQEKAP
jgi:hypothetical protein